VEVEVMRQINLARVASGGVLAGLIMSISEFVLHAVVLAADGQRLREEWERLGLIGEPDPSLLVWLVLATFGLGLLAVWTYAAIRPRMGPGAKTAICAGLLVWALSYLYAAVYVHAGVTVYPARLTWFPVAWSLVEVPVATIAGAWLYRE
jgi:hypothetical protein